MTHVIRVQNVCQALPAGLSHLLTNGVREESRAGPVLVSPGPVVTMTLNPTQRVLFSSVRDANPFFHIYEAIWMLAGRDDAAPLNRFVKEFSSSYGETGGEVHGAYGRRWRTAFGFDQLDIAVQKLREDPDSRQVVIQMWDCTPARFATFGHDDLCGTWRDRPCNSHIYLRLRRGRALRTIENSKVLDLTVLCRSNDIIWGAHGANAVHFSALQEYLAARLDAHVGVMYQFSHNYHAYLSEIERLCRRADVPAASYLPAHLVDDRYDTMLPLPLFDMPSDADVDFKCFVEWMDYHDPLSVDSSLTYSNVWFRETLDLAMRAHLHHRAGDWDSALRCAESIASQDWRFACTEWLIRRRR